MLLFFVRHGTWKLDSIIIVSVIVIVHMIMITMIRPVDIIGIIHIHVHVVGLMMMMIMIMIRDSNDLSVTGQYCYGRLLMMGVVCVLHAFYRYIDIGVRRFERVRVIYCVKAIII